MFFRPYRKKFDFKSGDTVLQVAEKHKLPLNNSCGGMGTCGTCLVRVEAGLEKLAPRNEIELELASALSYRDSERLSCQIEACEGLVVEIPAFVRLPE